LVLMMDGGLMMMVAAYGWPLLFVMAADGC
jgi:hypothetical protein